jgi:hypothetical protein
MGVVEGYATQQDLMQMRTGAAVAIPYESDPCIMVVVQLVPINPRLGLLRLACLINPRS